PWQLAQEKRPDISQEALMLPPVDLDALLNEKLDLVTQGGYDVYSAPYSGFREVISSCNFEQIKLFEHLKLLSSEIPQSGISSVPLRGISLNAPQVHYCVQKSLAITKQDVRFVQYFFNENGLIIWQRKRCYLSD
ncbi:hypothetical protein D4R78_07435, partial [bacterium]